MRVKTFYAKNMTDALKEIREAFGAEALLLSSKELTQSGAWGRSGGVEVVAAIDSPAGGDDLASDFRRLSEIHGASSGDGVEGGGEAGEVGEMEVFAPGEPWAKPVWTAADAMPAEYADSIKSRAARQLYHDLVAGGVDARLAGRMVSLAVSGLPAGKRRNRAAIIAATARLIPGMLAEDEVQGDLPSKKVVAFVGPTGVGKTTAIAKLAAHLALGRGKKVLVVSVDGYRIGAVEQLRSYAGLIGVPFRFAGDVDELRRQIEEGDRRDYILVDTAGRGRRDMDAMTPLAGFLRESRDVERHLVLSASMKPADMRRAEEQFEVCNPDHLLFTKLDETSTPGPILNELERTGKGFSYYTDGQRVPDDLHFAVRERIIGLVLERAGNALQA
ncbi:MAG: hypothetical protein LBT74_10850 [Acidobacteriota bacterium]|jgi:flagellar biosynthesis protein FlhF|nr:hypothetical protein [Acidobacteriota bacterium]